MSFTGKILAGLFTGIAAGLFFGEIAAPLNIAGNVFIGLLQMTVLPYIVLSLIVNLGRISWAESRGLLLAAIAVFAVMLLFGSAVLMLTPLAFPPTENASFFSTSLVNPPPDLDLVALYVPSNPFASMAGNMVPATVLFSILLGIGVSGLPGNAGLLRGLDVLADALNKVNKLVIKLTPYGVFAIAAGTAGTVSIEDISRLQGFVVTYTLLVLVLAFLVLPLFVRAVTPFRIKDFLGVPKDSLITIFATGKIIVLMPQLIENVQELFRRYELENDDVTGGSKILLPLAYPFPNLGTYVILMFVAFAAWYVDRPLDLLDQLTLQLASLFSSFIAPIAGIPFLLDLMRLPSDVMELFVVSTVYTDRIRVVLGALHLLVLTVVVLSIRVGVFRIDWRRLGSAVLVSIVSILAVLGGTRMYLAYMTSGEYRGDAALVQMRWMERTVDAKSYRDELPPADDLAGARGRLDRIVERGTLRVGYLPDSLPWAFSNQQGVITGFDIELAHFLARDLDVSLEIVRMSLDDANELLATGQVDIVMSGLASSSDRLRRFRFAGSPLDLTLGFLVRDDLRKTFANLDSISAHTGLTIGIVQSDPAFRRQVAASLPNASIVDVDSPRAFLRGNRPDIDTVLYSAEGGSAWTLIYPDYSIVVPQPIVARIPAAFIVPPDDSAWAMYVDNWVALKRKDGTIDSLFRHWIHGEGAATTEPRWSIIRDVLGWID
jgi:Na+/H+-dicarboxylate symporter/ABC-type amino acid transport substrate-binding protein